jgi:hypothetical protein
MRGPLYAATIPTTTTVYVGLPVHAGCVGAYIAWLDATAAATITLELTSFGADLAPVDAAGAAWEWKDSGQTFTGPAASAAGSLMINLENVRQLRARLKIVTTAVSPIEIYDGVAQP